MARQLHVHVAQNAEERRRVFEFRYRLLVEDLGLAPAGANETDRQVREPIDDSAQHLFVSHNGRIQGSLRLLRGQPEALPQHLADGFGLTQFISFPSSSLCFSDRLLIAAAWRGSRVPAVLIGAAYKLLRQQRVRFDFCHCPPALVGLYRKLGYRTYTRNFTDPDHGLRVPMVLVTDDLAHLQSVNSPLAPLCREAGASARAAAWFQKTFPGARNSGKALRDEDAFWHYLTDQLHQNPLTGISLLNGLDYRQAMRLLRQAEVLAIESGELLVRAGDVGEEMFVLLSGEVEVRAGQGPGRVIARLEKGAVMGEIAFLSAVPRTADVRVTRDAEVLVLTQASLNALMAEMPEIAARFLLNMSLVLCERLRHRTISIDRRDPASAGAAAA